MGSLLLALWRECIEWEGTSAAMIDELHVQNVALIRDAMLLPARGLTVITGETGAGKTALIGALNLIVGGRADASLVREGSQGLSVEARLCSLAGASRVSSNGNANESADTDTRKLTHADTDKSADVDGDTVVQRTLSAEGRSRVHIDGHIASVGQLADSVGETIDLCGQHEHQKLLSSSNHRALLDAWAQDDLVSVKKEFSEAHQAATQAARVVEEIQHTGDLSDDAIERARFIVRRIDEVDPQPGEYEELAARLPLLENAESLARSIEGAHAALSADDAALDALGRSASLIDEAATVDPSLAAFAQSLREALYVVEDVARDIRSYGDTIDVDLDSLAVLQDRMGAMQDLMRSWGPTMEAVLTARDDARRTLSLADGLDDRLRESLAQQEQAEDILACAAERLHHARSKAAPQFAKAVCAQMERLSLSGVQLECAVEMLAREKWTEAGSDAVEFLFRPGTDMTARPLAKIASGGEVSRVMLAIKVVLGAVDESETLVFDEVDAGVGGAAARSLAALLVDLAKTHQVIVVTHLPQVAVYADAHYVVRKTQGSTPETTLTALSESDRVSEIARMLSGDTGKAALDHARELLAEATEYKATA